MASLQKKGESWYCQFYWRNRRFTFSVGRVTKPQAEAKAVMVDRTLELLERGTLEVPGWCDVVAFVKHDGKPPKPAERAEESQKKSQKPTLGSLRDAYLSAHEASLESNTRYVAKIHFKHLAATLGESFDLSTLDLAALQKHVDRRVKAVVPTTAEKEVRTLRAAWNWAVRMNLLSGPFPRGLAYPKEDEKPPFQTRAEIERQLEGLGAEQAAQLWETLYLTLPEIESLLAFVRDDAAHPWIYPMVATAAHTGMRRSELIRMRKSDVDFEGGTVLVREKKRQKGKRTTRRVPLSTALAGILKGWIDSHPGGPYLFCHAEEVARSRKRSRTTGHKNGKERPTTLAGRMADVRNRERRGFEPLTHDEATDHLRRVLTGEWAVVGGWHTLRHSFISACASKGVDQRLLQEWCGHMTAEMSRRYAHLYPSAQRAALRGVFG